MPFSMRLSNQLRECLKSILASSIQIRSYHCSRPLPHTSRIEPSIYCTLSPLRCMLLTIRSYLCSSSSCRLIWQVATCFGFYEDARNRNKSGFRSANRKPLRSCHPRAVTTPNNHYSTLPTPHTSTSNEHTQTKQTIQTHTTYETLNCRPVAFLDHAWSIA
jgi:hypothetical protein